MVSEKSGPLESGDREVSYVLEDKHGSDLYHPTDIHDAWEKRQDLLNTPRVGPVYLIREDRTVIPPEARVDHYGVVDVSEVHEALNAARATMLGEAAEVDSLRPHRHPYLYDVTAGLRYRARLTAEAMERLETDGPPRADGSGGDDEGGCNHDWTFSPGDLIADEMPEQTRMPGLGDPGPDTEDTDYDYKIIRRVFDTDTGEPLYLVEEPSGSQLPFTVDTLRVNFTKVGEVDDDE